MGRGAGGSRRVRLGRICLVGFAMLCPAFLFGISSSPIAAEEPKIGYVSLGRLFDAYERTKQSEQTLEQQGKQKQGELEARVSELKKLRESLELLNDNARESKAKELDEKAEEFQRLKTRSERELLRERNQAARQILDEIDQTVKDYATVNGFSVILDQRSVLYGQDAYDVTDEVLKILNDRYAAQGGKAKR